MSTDPESTSPLDPNSPSLDDLIEQALGEFGLAQFLQVILVSLSVFFDGQQTFISDYTDAKPSWHCTDLAICNSKSNTCKLPRDAWSWDGRSDKTIITEWSLQCSSSILTGLPASSFFVGCLLGGFLLSTLGDSVLGRRNLLFLSCFSMSATAFGAAFANNIWVYTSLRFVSGFFRAPIVTCVIVLSTEMVGKKWRGQALIIGLVSFTLGLLSLPMIAYFNRDSSWRALYLWTSIPAFAYSIVAYFFVAESTRWLFMQGREAEAVAVLKRLASKDNYQADHSLNSRFSDVHFKQETSKVSVYSSYKKFFEKRWAFRRILAVMALGFGCGMVYYGILLGVGNLGFNIYLSVTFNALLDLPSYALTSVLIGRVGRKSSVLGFMVVSGICSILCAIVKRLEIVQIGFELASFFFASTAFNIVLIYTTELFPTCVRNSATSMVRQAIICGAMFCPVLISAGSKNEFVSYGVFGSVSSFCGLFVVFLPETKGVSFCDTMDEQERKDSNNFRA